MPSATVPGLLHISAPFRTSATLAVYICKLVPAASPSHSEHGHTSCIRVVPVQVGQPLGPLQLIQDFVLCKKWTMTSALQFSTANAAAVLRLANKGQVSSLRLSCCVCEACKCSNIVQARSKEGLLLSHAETTLQMHMCKEWLTGLDAGPSSTM